MLAMGACNSHEHDTRHSPTARTAAVPPTPHAGLSWPTHLQPKDASREPGTEWRPRAADTQRTGLNVDGKEDDDENRSRSGPYSQGGRAQRPRHAHDTLRSQRADHNHTRHKQCSRRAGHHAWRRQPRAERVAAATPRGHAASSRPHRRPVQEADRNKASAPARPSAGTMGRTRRNKKRPEHAQESPATHGAAVSARAQEQQVKDTRSWRERALHSAISQVAWCSLAPSP